MHEPPAATILARADSVNLIAAISTLGISRTLWSSVTVPTTTAIFLLKVTVMFGDILPVFDVSEGSRHRYGGS